MAGKTGGKRHEWMRRFRLFRRPNQEAALKIAGKPNNLEYNRRKQTGLDPYRIHSYKEAFRNGQ